MQRQRAYVGGGPEDTHSHGVAWGSQNVCVGLGPFLASRALLACGSRGIKKLKFGIKKRKFGIKKMEVWN